MQIKEEKDWMTKKTRHMKREPKYHIFLEEQKFN